MPGEPRAGRREIEIGTPDAEHTMPSDAVIDLLQFARRLPGFVVNL